MPDPSDQSVPASAASVAAQASSARAVRAVRLVRLADDPATLPGELAHVWAEGDAAVVAPVDAQLDAAVVAALDGDARLPAGTALVVPTSGSTGVPRAVVLPHRALAASTVASLAALGCEPGQRWALALPLRHVAGLQVLARARALGTDVHVVADAGDPAAIAAAADHVEHIALVPTQLVRCLDAGGPTLAALARLRSVLVGGGPLGADRLAQAHDAGVRVVQSYGMTETCGGCVYDGVPLAGVELDVDGAGGAGAGGAGVGRIRLRGPMLAAGYLTDLTGAAGDAGADAGADGGSGFAADGWFVTDDLGRVGADGRLVVVGRADAVINTGGVKVDPHVVERLLAADATVADVVVLGVPDAEWSERVVAVVVPAGASDVGRAAAPTAPAAPTLERLRATVSAALPASHAPRELVLVGRIERDAMGKVSAAERARLAAAVQQHR